MKIDDARRLVALAEALEDFPELEKALGDDAPARGCTHNVLRISVESVAVYGSEPHGTVDVDMATARLLAPALRRIIADEFEKLGGEA